MLWAGLRLDSAVPEIRAKTAIGLSESSVSLMLSARDRLAINPRLGQVLEIPLPGKCLCASAPHSEWDAATLGKGSALGLVLLTLWMSALRSLLSLLSVQRFGMRLPLALGGLCFGFSLLWWSWRDLPFFSLPQRGVVMGSINNILSASTGWIWKAWAPIIGCVSVDFIDGALADGSVFRDSRHTSAGALYNSREMALQYSTRACRSQVINWVISRWGETLCNNSFKGTRNSEEWKYVPVTSEGEWVVLVLKSVTLFAFLSSTC